LAFKIPGSTNLFPLVTANYALITGAHKLLLTEGDSSTSTAFKVTLS